MIRLIQGLHLTATNKRHISQMIAANMTRGQSGRLSYTLEPIAESPDQFRYQISQKERDDYGRVSIRSHKGILSHE